MKNTISLLYVSVLFLLTGCVLEENSVLSLGFAQSNIFNGSTNLHKQSCTSLTFNGFAQIKEVSVSEKLTVHGKLQADNCQLNNIVVAGSAVFENCAISGSTNIFGTASFYESNVKKIKASTMLMSFKQSSVLSIMITKNSSLKKKQNMNQKVVLDDTLVLENIYFEQEGGVVELRGNSTIKGKVIGGKVVKI